jgi:hypothetical protein
MTCNSGAAAKADARNAEGARLTALRQKIHAILNFKIMR